MSEGEEENDWIWIPKGKKQRTNSSHRQEQSKQSSATKFRQFTSSSSAGGGGGGSGGREATPLLELALKGELGGDDGGEGMTPEEEQRRLQEEEDAILADDASNLGILKSVKQSYESSRLRRNVFSWSYPSFYRSFSPDEVRGIREHYCIDLEDTLHPDAPHDHLAPCFEWSHLRLPRDLVGHLQSRGLTRPAPIQMQGLPVALSGRDMIGIAGTGSGKTLAFVLPALLLALQQESLQPLEPGEGPLALVVSPSHELALQSREVFDGLARAVRPGVRSAVFIGGQPALTQLQALRDRGVHAAFCTPGRLLGFLKKRDVALTQCLYVCLDEADRLVDMGFEEEISEMFNYFSHPRQTLMFSATMPKKIQSFAKESLIEPCLVNVGKAGRVHAGIAQHFVFVDDDRRRNLELLQCLQETAPPALIFCDCRHTAEEVHEYLLLKGISSCCLHSGLAQVEREEAIEMFRSGAKDVLVGTDIASKGLDFSEVRHVINYNLPKEIEDYIHRIGRTGRGFTDVYVRRDDRKQRLLTEEQRAALPPAQVKRMRRRNTGRVSSFIFPNSNPVLLADIMSLLFELKCDIPQGFFDLLRMEKRDFIAQRKKNSSAECGFCGGMGHKITDCPKRLHLHQRKMNSVRFSAHSSGGSY